METFSIIAEQLTMLPNGAFNINTGKNIDPGERCSIIVDPTETMLMKFFGALNEDKSYWFQKRSRVLWSGIDALKNVSVAVNNLLKASPYRRLKIIVSGNRAVDFIDPELKN